MTLKAEREAADARRLEAEALEVHREEASTEHQNEVEKAAASRRADEARRKAEEAATMGFRAKEAINDHKERGQKALEAALEAHERLREAEAEGDIIATEMAGR